MCGTLARFSLCPWLRVKRASLMEEALYPSSKALSKSLHSGLGTCWHSELPAMAMPITKGLASAMEGSPGPLSASRSEGIYSFLLIEVGSIEGACHFFTDHRGQWWAIFLTFTLPFTARMRPDVMGRAEDWVPGKELMFSQTVICHKTLGNFFLGLS